MPFDASAASQLIADCHAKDMVLQPSLQSLRAIHNNALPISSLFPEILCLIFQQYVDISFQPTCTCTSRDRYKDDQCRPRSHGSRYWSLLTLSHVFTAWRTIILGTPVLWTRIDLVHLEDAEKRFGAGFLPLPKSSPLTVSLDSYVRCPSKSRARACDVGMGHSVGAVIEYFLGRCVLLHGRITEFIIVLSTSQTDSLFVLLSEHAIVFPNLVTLNLTLLDTFQFEWSPEIKWDKFRCPSLRNLTLENAVIPPWLLIEDHDLEVLSIALTDVVHESTPAMLCSLISRNRHTLRERNIPVQHRSFSI